MRNRCWSKEDWGAFVAAELQLSHRFGVKRGDSVDHWRGRGPAVGRHELEVGWRWLQVAIGEAVDGVFMLSFKERSFVVVESFV